MVRILSVSQNTYLLVTRNDALTRAGYAVSSPRTPDDAPSLLAHGDFQAVVIGDSVAPEQRKQIIPPLRNINPAIPIIFVHTSPEPREEPLADLSIDVGDDPAELVTVLHKLRI
jgi:DNA-binding response OmpR family regulator